MSDVTIALLVRDAEGQTHTSGLQLSHYASERDLKAALTAMLRAAMAQAGLDVNVYVQTAPRTAPGYGRNVFEQLWRDAGGIGNMQQQAAQPQVIQGPPQGLGWIAANAGEAVIDHVGMALGNAGGPYVVDRDAWYVVGHMDNARGDAEVVYDDPINAPIGDPDPANDP